MGKGSRLATEVANVSSSCEIGSPVRNETERQASEEADYGTPRAQIFILMGVYHLPYLSVFKRSGIVRPMQNKDSVLSNDA